MPLEAEKAQARCGGAVRSLLTVGSLFSLFLCAFLSNALLSLPLLGAGLYLAFSVAALSAHLAGGGRLALLPRRARGVFIGAALLSLIFFAVFFPWTLKGGDLLLPAGAALLAAARPWIARLAYEKALAAGEKPLRGLMAAAGVQALFLAALAAALLSSPLSRETAWALAACFALGGAAECMSLEKGEGRAAPLADADRQEAEALRGVYACQAYRRLAQAVAAALALTQTTGFLCAAVFPGVPLLHAALAFFCTWIAAGLTEKLLPQSIRENANRLLAYGLAAWLFGLIFFAMWAFSPWIAYPALALCAGGAACCVMALRLLREDMRRAAAFGLGHAPGPAAGRALRARVELAFLLGLAAALASLTLCAALRGWEKAASPSPLWTLPALLAGIVSVAFGLLFPLTQVHLGKLEKYAALRASGRDNAALREQLEAVAVRPSHKPYGVKLIILTLRIFYRHQVRGLENVHLDEDTPCVFVCNHGEIYGPVVTNVFVPFHFRPWVTYEMMDRKIVSDRCMEGTFGAVTGVKRKLLQFVMDHVGAPFMVWIMRSREGIPVYHDQPRKLMQTFRDTVAAMEAGDNILVFPENAATSADRKYAREGVSEFFTGFTMIGQLYQNKTGKSPLFIPLYADQSKRTVTFGLPTRYNAETNPNEEKERLCAYLRKEILRIAGLDAENA